MRLINRKNYMKIDILVNIWAMFVNTQLVAIVCERERSTGVMRSMAGGTKFTLFL